jgi:azurin
MKKLSVCLLFLSAISPLARAQAPVRVEVTCNDQMTYNTKRIEILAGQKVSLTLKNVGKIPVKTMGHNLVILKPDTPIAAFAGKAHAAKSRSYIPEAAEDRKWIVAHTRLLGGGESDTITFSIQEPGKYPFICSSPGHFSEMQGTIFVLEKPAPGAPPR